MMIGSLLYLVRILAIRSEISNIVTSQIHVKDNLEEAYKKCNLYTNLSTKEKLDDFNELLIRLEKNYIYYDYVKEKYWDRGKVIQQTKNLIKYTRNDLEFYYVLNDFINRTENLAHLYLNTNIEFFPTAYSNESKIVQLLENASVKEKYKTLEEILNLVELKYDIFSHIPKITYEYFSNTAYLKIPTFLEDYSKKEISQSYKELYNQMPVELEEFYKNLTDKYKYLVIDLRNNPGGFQLFGIEYLIAPLIKNPLKCEFKLLYNENEYNDIFFNSLMEYNDNNTIEYNEEHTTDFNFIKHYDNIKLNNCKLIKEVYHIQPKDIGVTFKGKIFILCNDKCYSGCDNFINICKQTHFATIIGNRTKGDGFCISPFKIILNNSGLIVDYTATFGINDDGSSNAIEGTRPDIELKDEDALTYIMEKTSSELYK